MFSRNLNDTAAVDLEWASHGEIVLVEIKRTSSARDIREALLSLAYALREHEVRARGLCVVVGSRLSGARLRQELEHFRMIVHPDLAERVYLVSADEGHQLHGALPVQYADFQQAVRDAIKKERSPTSSRVTRQHVVASLVERHLNRLEPLSMAEIGRRTGASHPTVASAVAHLTMIGALGTEREGPVALRHLSASMLNKIADEHAAARQTIRFQDPTGQARTPRELADRLATLRRKGMGQQVGIGGVIGASHYFPQLNVTAAPRLDLSVFDADTSFLRKIDAGLIEADRNPYRQPVLVLHLQRDCRPREMTDAAPELAARLDCLADLRELGLHAEADEFAYELSFATKGS